MIKFNEGSKACGVLMLWAVIAIALPAQTFTSLHSFNDADGSYPRAALVQTNNGNLYGTTETGGPNGQGTVFKITPGGALTTIYNFCPNTPCTDGAKPGGALVQAADGSFYGTTEGGGMGGHGTIFKITPGGTLTTLYRFCPENDCTDGARPTAGLILGADGDWYGTTSEGGISGNGTVFKITPRGALTSLYHFCMKSHCADGADPATGLVEGDDGNFYGTTEAGGANRVGAVFKITPDGALTILHSFNGTDGQTPLGLVLATDGNFYGTTLSGGATVFYGSVFKVTPKGALTSIYSFCSQSGCADGNTPFAGLIQGSDGNFYGTTFIGGANSNGTVFQITPSGALTVLYNFCSQGGSLCTDGDQPIAGLVQDTNGKLYGTTGYGGVSSACHSGCGTIFRLSIGLGPFVETHPSSGEVGAAVNILGSNLARASSVTFDGVAAAFTSISSTLITTTVPAGAATGTVQVVTPGGSLSSNVTFHVTP
jgi:uncharacterized repeat protein (TIGR03803 family)